MTYPLPGANWTYLHSLRLVATTGLSGYALVNGTGTIISWTAPDDGNLHRAFLLTQLDVTSSETGGVITLEGYFPNGSSKNAQIFGANAGGLYFGPFASYMIEPGTTLTLAQTTALTAGASTLWAEFWAS